MELFIAWSGNSSKKIAEVFRDWIPKVLQSVKPYFSPADTEKGSKWNTEVSKKLKECQFGIICLTPDNLQSSWILFEAGALSNTEKSYVSPILFDIEASQLSSPLAIFQATEFNEAEVKQLFYNINDKSEPKLAVETFNSVFVKWWPELRDSIQNILDERGKENIISKPRDQGEMIEEMLELVRGLVFDKKPKFEDSIYVGKKFEEINSDEKAILDQYIKSSYQNIKEHAKQKNEQATDVEQKIFEELHLVEDVKTASGSNENLKRYIWEYLLK